MRSRTSKIPSPAPVPAQLSAPAPVPAPLPANLTCLGCFAPVPEELAGERLCVLHFTHRVEESCYQIRRDAAISGMTPERFASTSQTLKRYSASLAHLVTGSQRLPDDLKKRVLTTFWTLMVVQETVTRNAEAFVAAESKKKFFARSA